MDTSNFNNFYEHSEGSQDMEISSGVYQGRTELGVGQHDKIKKKLDEERHQEYQDHMARKAREETTANFRKAEGDDEHNFISRSGSVMDIGYETSQKFAQQRKILCDARRAEYAALIATHTGSSRAHSQDGDYESTDGQTLEIEANGHQFHAPGDGEISNDQRKLNQRSYADALREQIAEKKRASEQNKKKEQEEDKKNMEWAQGSNKNFNYGSYNSNNVS